MQGVCADVCNGCLRVCSCHQVVRLFVNISYKSDACETYDDL